MFLQREEVEKDDDSDDDDNAGDDVDGGDSVNSDDDGGDEYDVDSNDDDGGDDERENCKNSYVPDIFHRIHMNSASPHSDPITMCSCHLHLFREGKLEA